jgi:hypothetical protein
LAGWAIIAVGELEIAKRYMEDYRKGDENG